MPYPSPLRGRLPGNKFVSGKAKGNARQGQRGLGKKGKRVEIGEGASIYTLGVPGESGLRLLPSALTLALALSLLGSFLSFFARAGEITWPPGKGYTSWWWCLYLWSLMPLPHQDSNSFPPLDL